MVRGGAAPDPEPRESIKLFLLASVPIGTQFRVPIGHGVIYLPATERQSHYFHVRPNEQFDAMIHIDNTCALEPLELTSEWIAGEVPETYPIGL